MPCVVVLSPHLDDAVLSAWHAVAAGGTTVVTTFAGIPRDGFVTDLDRAHGARDSAAWMRRRRAEDRDALAVGSASPVHLDLLDAQFAAYEMPAVRAAVSADPERFVPIATEVPELSTDPARLVTLAVDHIPRDAVVYGPVGVGGHPDHRDLGRAAVRLAGSGRVGQLRLYADSPYYVLPGLPEWLGGPPNPAADRAIERAMAVSGADRLRLRRYVVRLDDDTLAAKIKALRCYRTELPSIESAVDVADWMRHEVYWAVA
jgi:LmbE family N-acetylglucosaminyl deacetylase